MHSISRGTACSPNQLFAISIAALSCDQYRTSWQKQSRVEPKSGVFPTYSRLYKNQKRVKRYKSNTYNTFILYGKILKNTDYERVGSHLCSFSIPSSPFHPSHQRSPLFCACSGHPIHPRRDRSDRCGLQTWNSHRRAPFSSPSGPARTLYLSHS